jgi:fucose permease
MSKSAATENPQTERLAYLTGSLQGFAFSLLPALATVLTSPSYALSAKSYGLLFIPQTIFAVIGAFLAPAFARKYNGISTLKLGIIANILALLALLASAEFHTLRYLLLLFDAGALGLGFGLCNSSANALVQASSKNPDRAVTVLNILVGLGTSLSPVIIGSLRLLKLEAFSPWLLWPLGLAGLFMIVFIVAWRTHSIDETAKPTGATGSPNTPKMLWLLAGLAVLYGTCEGSLSTWATALAQEHGASIVAAAFSLTVFWLALTLFRIFSVIFPKLVPLRNSVTPLGILTAITLAVLPELHGSFALVLGYLLAGIGCGIIYPYLLANALDAFPNVGERVAGYLTAGLMIGEGIGSFAIGAVRSMIGISGAYRCAAAVALVLSIVWMLSINRFPSKTVKSNS